VKLEFYFRFMYHNYRVPEVKNNVKFNYLETDAIAVYFCIFSTVIDIK